MAKQKSLMLKIGVAMAITGCILIANFPKNEPLWVQWVLGFGLFYLGIPIAIVGAAMHFVVNKNGNKDPFPSPASSGGKDHTAG
jgi:uncharacterized membrane protein HdeD (DUF308 family)